MGINELGRGRRLGAMAIIGLLLSVQGALPGAARAQLPVEEWSVEALSFPPHPHRTYIADLEFDNLVSSRITVVDPDEQRYLA